MLTPNSIEIGKECVSGFTGNENGHNGKKELSEPKVHRCIIRFIEIILCEKNVIQFDTCSTNTLIMF